MGGAKKFGWGKIFDFKGNYTILFGIPPFSKDKMTICSEHLGGHIPLGPL